MDLNKLNDYEIMIVFNLREDSTRDKAQSYKLSHPDVENDSTTSSLFLFHIRRMFLIIVYAFILVLLFQKVFVFLIFVWKRNWRRHLNLAFLTRIGHICGHRNRLKKINIKNIY